LASLNREDFDAADGNEGFKAFMVVHE